MPTFIQRISRLTNQLLITTSVLDEFIRQFVGRQEPIETLKYTLILKNNYIASSVAKRFIKIKLMISFLCI